MIKVNEAQPSSIPSDESQATPTLKADPTVPHEFQGTAPKTVQRCAICYMSAGHSIHTKSGAAPALSEVSTASILPHESNPKSSPSLSTEAVAGEDDYVAWCRYDFTDEETIGATINTCDSDAKGAFKVYRAPYLAGGESVWNEAIAIVKDTEADKLFADDQILRNILVAALEAARDRTALPDEVAEENQNSG